MKHLLIIALLISFTSCLTVKRIEKNCDMFAKVCLTGYEKEIHDTVIYIHDTIPVKLPSDTVKIKAEIETLNFKDDIQFPNNFISLDTIHRENGNIGMDAWVNAGILEGQAYYIKPELSFQFDSALLVPKVIIREGKTVTLKEKYIPKVYKFAFWFTLIVFIIIGLYLYLKFSNISAWFLKVFKKI